MLYFKALSTLPGFGIIRSNSRQSLLQLSQQEMRKNKCALFHVITATLQGFLVKQHLTAMRMFFAPGVFAISGHQTY